MFNNKKEATMKKTYKNPSMVVVKIQTRHMLASSPTSVNMYGSAASTDAMGRDFDFDDEE